MVVDKTASATEKAHIHTILSGDGSTWTTDEVNRRIKKFIDRVKVQGFLPTLDEACDKASALPMSRVEKLVQNCITLAKGDSEFHDRERKAIGRIQTKLPQLQFKNIAEHQQRAEKSRDFQVTTAGKVTPKGEYGWLWSAISFILVTMLFVGVWYEKRELRRQFERIESGMPRAEVIEMFGEPSWSHEDSDGTTTTLYWGTRHLRYRDEFRFLIRLSDGVVFSKDWQEGSESRPSSGH
jgi:hypothetical protein